MVRPVEINEEAWAQMNDQRRAEAIDTVARRWYETIGRHWSDEQWVSYLSGRKGKQ